jgi:hypothetical protein
VGEELGGLLGERAVEALGGAVESYGKAAIVGLDGECEHAAAILHPTLGTAAPRSAAGGVSVGEEAGSGGLPIDVPLHCKDAALDHFDAMGTGP